MSETKSLSVSRRSDVLPIVPKSTDEITRIASYLVNAEALPRSYVDDRIADPKERATQAAKKASIAIMKGLELGWLPMQSIQNMYVVNGIPTVYGDGAIAIIRASGKLEYCREWFEGEGDERTAFCEVKRRGEEKPVVRSFSRAQAARAKLLGKPGPWQLYTDRMQQMRARALALRDVFADILLGLRIKEEVEDYEVEAAPALNVDPFANAPMLEAAEEGAAIEVPCDSQTSPAPDAGSK